MKKSDFTLIELLLISGMCIVAAALVMPCRAIADGKSVSCTDNLRKIGKVMAQYSDSFDGCVPGFYQSPSVTANEYRWCVAMAKFDGDPAPYCCPDSKAYDVYGAKLSKYDTRNPRNTANLFNFIDAVSVGVNALFCNVKQFKAFEYSGRKLFNITNAEKLSYAADVVGRNAKLYPSNAGQAVGSYFGPRVTPTRGASIDPRHGESANILYADGHVGNRSRDELSRMCANWAKAPNNSFFLVNR